MSTEPFDDANVAIAVIGMSGAYPGARDLNRFWENLRDGVESITFFTDEEHEIPSWAPGAGSWVKARGVLEDPELFDAGFFGYTPAEATAMDPQHRLFLERGWEAIEVAGYDPESYHGSIGVFGGVSSNTYTLASLFANPTSTGLVLTDKDFLATRLSYRLNLRGPSVVVQTACSTSLVAVSLACQSLLNYQCDIALAGGSSICVPLKSGYPYQLSGPMSPDGHCRAFDAEGRGFVPGHGVGVVALKRLSEAVVDGDTIWAMIKGSAVNNDGSAKIGYTAPSVDGQAEVIALAQEFAGVDPETITYLEAHGTGTELGDPIEIAALTKVFRAATSKTGFCAVGSVKPNIGHLDAAAGIASLQKVVLALQHGQLPPSANFELPNAKIDFASSPFFVNDRLRAWEPGPGPRRAGVSSFGIGGTNAHVIVEEAPAPGKPDPARPWQLLPLSARSAAALQNAADRLADHLESHPEIDLADTAFTLQAGRKAFGHRRFVVAEATLPAAAALRDRTSEKLTRHDVEGDRRVIFMFPGQGAQYPNMGRELYEGEPVFRGSMDECCRMLEPELGLDLRNVIYPDTVDPSSVELGNQTALAQPALFVVEYAMARLWRSWGVEPAACIGHSVGEYVAACLAGVFRLSDALGLVAQRARLINRMPPGAMLAVPLTEEQVRPYLSADVSLAAVNGPSICIVSGPAAPLDELQAQLKSSGVPAIKLKASNAFHSPMMDPILDEFERCFGGLELRPPQIPFVSNLTGGWIEKSQPVDPAYWVRHLRQTVRFSDGLELLAGRDWALLEVGPGRTLSNLALSHPRAGKDRLVATSLPERRADESEIANLLSAVGKLWLGGVRIDWAGLNRPHRRRRVPLPTYPFERQRYWALDNVGEGNAEPVPSPEQVQTPGRERFFVPSWRRAPSRALSDEGQSPAAGGHTWLIMTDRAGLGLRLEKGLSDAGCPCVTVEAGAAYRKLGDRRYQIDPRSGPDYAELLYDLQRSSLVPEVVANLWGVTPADEGTEGEDASGSGPDQFYSLIHLAQALANARVTSLVRISAVTSGAHLVLGDEVIVASKSLVRGPCLVIPQENANLSCRHIDLELASPAAVAEVNLGLLIDEISNGSAEPVVAHRKGYRWVQTYEPVSLDNSVVTGPTRLRPGGVYLITGGLGAIGLTLAGWLAGSTGARIALTHRSTFPPAQAWPGWLAEHPEDDPTSRRIRGLAAVEQAGGEVLVLQADVCDLSQMRQVLETVHRQFGRVNGAIHAAGVPGGGLVQLKTQEMADQVLAPKVEGLQTLARVLAGEPLDFMVLCSSVTAIVGGFGQVDYCSANAFMDAFAWQQKRSGGPETISINWNAWSDAGMAAQAELPGNLKQFAGRFSAGDSLTNQEGVEAFRRILTGGIQAQVAISRSNLSVSLAQQLKTHSLEDLARLAAQLTSVQARPDLRVPYREPVTETETAVAKLWRACFGFEEIGIGDDFLDLGGHSLLAIQLLEKVNEEMGMSLLLADLFEHKTVEALSRHIDLTLWASGRADEGDGWNEGREEFTL
jgi:acyl transferase domain-containing protein/NAD(P)-dependent dehydrogenase (short-subunit alcohol dehydrogenase family)